MQGRLFWCSFIQRKRRVFIAAFERGRARKTGYCPEAQWSSAILRLAISVSREENFSDGRRVFISCRWREMGSFAWKCLKKLINGEKVMVHCTLGSFAEDQPLTGAFWRKHPLRSLDRKARRKPPRWFLRRLPLAMGMGGEPSSKDRHRQDQKSKKAEMQTPTTRGSLWIVKDVSALGGLEGARLRAHWGAKGQGAWNKHVLSKAFWKDDERRTNLGDVSKASKRQVWGNLWDGRKLDDMILRPTRCRGSASDLKNDDIV